MHHDNILEIEKAGLLDLLKGVRVLYENTMFVRHPLIKGDWRISFVNTLSRLQRVVPNVGVVIDLEHLASSLLPTNSSLGDFLQMVEQYAPISEVHLCDSLPGYPWRGHLVPGNGSRPITEELRLISGRYPNAAIVIEQVPTIDRLSFFFSSATKRHNLVCEDIKQALDFIYGALRAL
jgi:sugar phosphate isomerase/epimerase